MLSLPLGEIAGDMVNLKMNWRRKKLEPLICRVSVANELIELVALSPIVRRQPSSLWKLLRVQMVRV